MTTDDPFIEAAHDEAAKRWPHLPHRPETHVLNVGKRVGFDLGARWARTHLAAQETDGPRMAPFGIPVGAAGVQEVWDAFVKPSQSDDAPPQSVEMRELMAILRWAYTVLDAEGSAARAARRDEEKR